MRKDQEEEERKRKEEEENKYMDEDSEAMEDLRVEILNNTKSLLDALKDSFGTSLT